LPEFQKLVTENAELKLALHNIENSMQSKNKITLEVNEKPQDTTKESPMGDPIMKTVHLNDDINDDKNDLFASSMNNTKNKELMESFYNAIGDASESDEDTVETETSDDNANLTYDAGFGNNSKGSYVIDRGFDGNNPSATELSEKEDINSSDDEEAEEEDAEEVEEEEEEEEDDEEEEEEDAEDEDEEVEEDAEGEDEEVEEDAEGEDAEDEDAEEEDAEEEDEERGDVEEDAEDEDEDAEEEEVYIVELEIDGKTVQFYTNDDENGDMYKILENEDIGDIVGEFKNGEAILHK
jgi:hypothetical protein